MELEINSMVIKSKTYCEKWPIGCQTCDLTKTRKNSPASIGGEMNCAL